MDSMLKDKDVFDDIIDMINRVWVRFRANVRGEFKEELSVRMNFSCLRQEQGTNLYGYYVCEFIHRMLHAINTDKDIKITWMKDQLPQTDYIKIVQEQLMGFVVDEIENSTTTEDLFLEMTCPNL